MAGVAQDAPPSLPLSSGRPGASRGASPASIGRALHRRLVAIFAVSSAVAIVTGLVLFLFGLDFTAHQRRVVFFLVTPLALIPMTAIELTAIRYISRPIRSFFNALEQRKERKGESGSREDEALRALAGEALVRALNLPVLSAFRVLVIHAPSFVLPTTFLAVLANRYLYLDMEDWQFLLIWVTTFIFTAGHAIYEYFAVAAASGSIIPEIREHTGDLDPKTTARIIPLGMKRKLLFVFFFIAVVPSFVLGATALLKIDRMLRTLDVPGGDDIMTRLNTWVGLLFFSGSALVLAMSALLAREITQATHALVRSMKRVESGQLDQRLSVLTTDEFADLYNGFNRMTSGLVERERLRDAFGRYVAPEIAEEIMRRGVSMGGDTVTASVLFADIRDFTSISEQLRPAEVVDLLNRYFAAVEPAIRAEGGFINKFGGDSLLAVFGAPVPAADHAARAVRSAIGMRRALADFNERERAAGRAPIRFGIGISSGEMVAGSVGSPDRMEYTVIGDVVNVASRIQGLNKEWGTDILISAETYSAMSGEMQVKVMPPISVKGKSARIQVYAIE